MAIACCGVRLPVCNGMRVQTHSIAGARARLWLVAIDSGWRPTLIGARLN